MYGTGDYDNDGDLDIFLKTTKWESVYGSDKLYRNNGDGTFTDVTKETGLTFSGSSNVLPSRTSSNVREKVTECTI
jgi:hypothetical protein